MVNLEIVVDYPKQSELRRECREVGYNFTWPHGSKNLRFREQKAGLKFQWFEIWYPPSDKDVLIGFEDDVEARWEPRSLVFGIGCVGCDHMLPGPCTKITRPACGSTSYFIQFNHAI